LKQDRFADAFKRDAVTQADVIRRLKRDLAQATDLSRTRNRSGGLFSGRMGAVIIII
jgi:ethanolamine utilization microcompartment shell protein EutL